VYYDPADMAVTSKGHKVSRSCILYGTQNIVLSEHTILMAGCIVRGDLACVRMGRYCVVQDRTVIRPSYKQFSKGFTYFPYLNPFFRRLQFITSTFRMNIGEHVFIEQDW
jgi:dynactin-5